MTASESSEAVSKSRHRCVRAPRRSSTQVWTHSPFALFSEGFEVQLNPSQTWLEQAVERVQARARTNRLTRQEAAETLRRVTIGGETSACAGLKNCPASFPLSQSRRRCSSWHGWTTT
jgi:hypothetical protein